MPNTKSDLDVLLRHLALEALAHGEQRRVHRVVQLRVLREPGPRDESSTVTVILSRMGWLGRTEATHEILGGEGSNSVTLPLKPGITAQDTLFMLVVEFTTDPGHACGFKVRTLAYEETLSSYRL